MHSFSAHAESFFALLLSYPPMWKAILMGAAIVAQGALAGCSAESQAQERTAAHQAVQVDIVRVERKPVDVLYYASGTVKGRNTAIMTSKVAGYVQKLLVDAGDEVAEGQSLVVLDSDVVAEKARGARAALSAQRHSVLEAESGLASAESSATVAASTFERVKALYESLAVSQQQFDDAKAQFDAAMAARGMARARLESVKAHVEAAKASVSEANAMLGYSEIKSPFAGRVIERLVDLGNLASPGMPLLVVEQEGALRVEAFVEESKVGEIASGAKVIIEVPALEMTLDGVVDQVVPTVDVASRALKVKVDLSDPEACKRLRPGMFARAKFTMGQESRLIIPHTAVSARGQLDRVFVLDHDRARLRVVSLGARRGDWIEVLSGLTVGEQLVRIPPPDLRDGSVTTAAQPAG